MEEKEVQKEITRPRLRLTPLNILTAVALVAGIYFLVQDNANGMESGFNWLFVLLCFLGALVCFVSDLIFRKMVPLLKNLWIVETAFLVLTVSMVLVIKYIIS